MVLESCPKSLGFSQDGSPVSLNSSNRSYLTHLTPYSHWSWFSFYCYDKDHGQKQLGKEKKESIWLVHPNHSPPDRNLETRTNHEGVFLTSLLLPMACSAFFLTEFRGGTSHSGLPHQA